MPTTLRNAAAAPTPSLRQVLEGERVMAEIAVPRTITREVKVSSLALPDGSCRRRLRLSTNWLQVVGFAPDTRFTAESIGPGKGVRVKFSPSGANKIHLRRYGRKRNNPLESQVDIQTQSLIDAAIPSATVACRWEVGPSGILILPLPNRVFTIGKSMRQRAVAERFDAFVGLTSGVDVRLLERHGFTVRGILEFRPQEARDVRSREEVGALNALANSPNIHLLANEDIYRVSWERVAELLAARDRVVPVLHLSPQCDDFSPLKTCAARQASIDQLSSTIDMVVPLIRGVEVLQPATVVVENVPGFFGSQAGVILALQLRRLGYHVSTEVLKAPDFGGLTTRHRGYLVASVWPGFEFPRPTARNGTPLHEMFATEIALLRDMGGTSSLQKGLAGGRARVVEPGDTLAPTVLKSQQRMAKDSVVIRDGSAYRFVDGPMSKRLMGLEDVNTELVNGESEGEIIGQSVEGPMHGALMDALRGHILKHTDVGILPVHRRLL
jgi:DNA (cytosine-5)-methyltransferase 1